jgi:hypothetical protein
MSAGCMADGMDIRPDLKQILGYIGRIGLGTNVAANLPVTPATM